MQFIRIRQTFLLSSSLYNYFCVPFDLSARSKNGLDLEISEKLMLTFLGFHLRTARNNCLLCYCRPQDPMMVIDIGAISPSLSF